MKYLGWYILSGNAFHISLHYLRVCFYQCFNSLFARGSNFSEPVLQHLVNTCCKLYLLYGCQVIIWTKSELSNISYAFNSVLCRIYRVKHDLLSCICEYTGQSNILDEISNRHIRFVTQSLCSPNLPVRFWQYISVVSVLYISVNSVCATDIISE